MSKPSTVAALSAVETIEEAVALLRRTPAALLLCPWLGGVPFWLLLLLFLTDMSRDAYAAERLLGMSLGLTILYLWKKCWESVFASGLHTLLAREEPEPWSTTRLVRLIAGQARIQYWGLLARPLAYVATFPAAWISAYYQSATVLGSGRQEGAKSLSARAWSRAQLWPGQNHTLLLILFFSLGIVWINVAMLLGAVPAILKSGLAIETTASHNYSSYLNSTFFAATFAAASLLLEPLWKAAYVVRCFHGAALHSGADIRASLQALRERAPAAALALLLWLSLPVDGALAQSPPALPPAAAVDPVVLDRSLGQVLERREFAWRARRLEAPEAKKEEGVISRWLRQMKEAVGRKFREFLNWLIKRRHPQDETPSFGSGFSIPPLESVLYVAGAVVVGLLVWVGWRTWRRPRVQATVARAVAVEPDLQSPDLVADQLPEDGWMKLARELLARGELRLALRAAYLAGLATLGEQQFVSIARHKSNRDYQRELRRRARTREDLLAAFEENLLVFERAWYGDHGVTLPMFEDFTRNLQRLRPC